MTPSKLLPVGWSSCELGTVLKMKYGKSLPESQRHGNGAVVYGSNGRVGEHGEPLVQSETLVIGRKGSVGAVHHAREPSWPIDTTYYVDDLHGMPFRYWYWALKQLNLSELNRATAIPGLNRDDACRSTVVVPPIAEQQRIADKLDALFNRMDTCRGRLDRVPGILRRFRQGVLSAAVSGRLTDEWRAARPALTVPFPLADNKLAVPLKDNFALEVPDSWCIIRARDAVDPAADIVYGIVQPGPKLVEGIPYVQITDIVEGRIHLQGLSFTSAEIAKSYKRSSIAAGDVLLGIIRATKVVVVPDGLEGANISRSVARLRPRDGLLPEFLAIALEAPAVQGWLRAQHRGMDMPVLNLSEVRLAPIPIAPLHEQEEIVRRVEVLFALVDAIEAKWRTARAQIERLTPALLAKAFRGELVPQDPNDEPASVLLKRFEAEHAAAPPVRPRTRRVASGAK